MKLNKINSSTYYIDAPTNSGIVTFKNKNCLIIDTGLNNSAAKKIDDIIIENKLHPKYIINTHSHLDHCGGNIYFQKNYPGVLVYTSKMEKLFMENEDLHASILCSSYPLKSINKSNKPIEVDYILDYGINKIGDEKFNIIPLPGHSIEHIGITTSDKVCFLGDSIFSSEILEKYSFPYLYNISNTLNSLKTIKEIDADYFLISHSQKPVTKEEIIELVDKNIKNINNYKNQLLELLDQPLTKEDILENITILNNLKLNFNEYYLNLSGVSAFISYLYNNRLIDCSIEDGKLYYFKAK
ncbi:MBL fold metallo-hydrolase [Clostridium tyrobutyricum]|jgi:glyoxylase-like metal-dependent hydrolase (beta-lactamase superfamily II)|uniref:Zinc metallohydrolase, glyoxalase II family n=1 Tax=Clostridium tyrobutyricum DIVETGP TaxID=1408889 RepID=W6N726_CLOTY|nr:MBL fold metallo-hydrolase [Clostridium tyrobutyricum]AND85626.1 zinc-dependent hydrolase [Clostridium tyrobutyricum]ANP70150.1 hydrolase [Clostridium tyrobutyricum]MBR9647922.1 MBL fold metallo-hydrolase [Clostridium tyrobutyricum]MBV4415083.1 MBL fold metallo-hydrolase [Clostridium tyrobutyricum]MBV4421091.1 MBL fold metallo-hydrolase [Clostridium tyrobutyricum]